MPNNRTHIKGNTYIASSPTTYGIKKIVLTNHRGEEVDINHLITEFSITESIYSPTLLLSVSINDSVNFMEQYELCGQEKILISLARQMVGSEVLEKLEHVFYVTEYPIYGRPREHLQVYKISGISFHSYLSNFKKISRYMSGNSAEVIEKILLNDCECSTDSIVHDRDASGKKNCIGIFSGIIPNFSPVLAIDWLRRKMYASDSSPFFIFENAQSKINILSYKTLTEQDIYRTFLQHSGHPSNPNDEFDYAVTATRIFDIASSLKMQKSIAAIDGAFASSQLAVDISTKKFIGSKFSYNDDFQNLPSIQKHSVVSGLNSVGKSTDKKLDGLSAFTNYLPLNSGNTESYHDNSKNHSLRAKSILALSEFSSHDIKVAGDFSLNAGLKIRIEVPKALDPQYLENGKKNDQLISGDYLITSVIHEFGSKYFCSMKVKNDSFAFSLK